MAFSSVEELVEDLRAGKMIVLLDDEDRENERAISLWRRSTSPPRP